MILLENVHKKYTSFSGEVHALKAVNLTIHTGENVVIIGKSGSGKSTLLNLLSGIDRPTSGNIQVFGENLNTLNESDLALWRGKQVGIVFQFYQLLPTLSALDNILFAMKLVNKVPTTQRMANAKAYLEEVGLSDKGKKFPNQLSGGERQRVAIARAMANNPKLIIADEPTGNLDSKTSTQVDALFERLHQKGTTIIRVTHENIEAKKFDRVIKIIDGELIQ